jgi:SAM-dependent methyltransferase
MTDGGNSQTDATAYTTLRQWFLEDTRVPMLTTAAQLGIADLLADGPQPIDELAQVTGTHAPSLHRLMRALVGLGVFVEDADGCFGIAPMGACLRRDATRSLRATALWAGSPSRRAAWGDLLYSVQTGNPAFDRIYGMNYWEYLDANPEAGAVFNEHLAGIRPERHAAVVAAYDFSAVRTLVDIGGGYGQLLAAALSACPDLRGILFDLPSAVERARATLATAGVAERCELVGGDMFTAELPRGDAYVLSNVIHDWGDDQSNLILQNCRRAVVQDGRLLLIEQVLIPANTPMSTLLNDVNMLVSEPGGRQRTEAELREMLRCAGFRLTRVIATAGDASILESTPV